jgi:hypothetical protein
MNKWTDIQVGDFFVPMHAINGQTYLYQKIHDAKCAGYNAILLNTGEVCNIYIDPDSSVQFKKVQVQFEIRQVNDTAL